MVETFEATKIRITRKVGRPILGYTVEMETYQGKKELTVSSIHIKDLSCLYGEENILHNISAEFQKWYIEIELTGGFNVLYDEREGKLVIGGIYR